MPRRPPIPIAEAKQIIANINALPDTELKALTLACLEAFTRREGNSVENNVRRLFKPFVAYITESNKL